MGIKKEWTCLAHGGFESDEDSPCCPAGCDTVERAFFTPPGLASARTKNIDRTLEGLAKSHNLSDIGPGAMRRKALAAEKAQQEYREFCEKRFGGLGWGNVPQGATMNVKTQEIKGEGPGAVSAVAGVGASGSVASDTRASILPAQIPAVYHKDPQNLQLNMSKAA